jgi:hypothetical protein
MDLMALTEFTWNAIAGGVAHDALKLVLGKGFERLSDQKNKNQREHFNNALLAILETNDEVRDKITNLANGGNVTTITTGNINSKGNVIIGHNNQM